MRRTIGRTAAVSGSLAALMSLAIFASAGPAGAAGQDLVHVGRAASVVEDVQGRIGDQPPKRITVDERLFFEQRIITTDNSRTVVEFRDGSELQIGPDAVVSLDRFVFNPFESKSEKVITSLSGAFRYVSGMKTKSSSLEIRTPTATIGVRGSLAEWLVHPDLPTFFSLQHGLATVQTLAGRVEVNPGQAVAVVSRNSPPSPPAPAPIVAQVLNHIDKAIGNPSTGKPLTDADAKTDTTANMLPTTLQGAQQKGPLTPLTSPGNMPLLTDVPLLQQAAALGLFTNTANQPLTPAQVQFLDQANKAFPNALQQIQSAVQKADQATSSNAARSTDQIVGGAAKFTDNKGALPNLVVAVVAADPDHAAVAVGAAIKFAPGEAIAIATSAARAVPGKVADIAIGAIGANPNLAGALVVALGSINPSAITQIAAAAAKAAPGKASDILNSLANLPSVDKATLVAAISSSLSQQQAAALLSDVAPAGGGDAGVAFGDIPAGTSPPAPPPENPAQTGSTS